MTLSPKQMESILAKIEHHIETRFYNPLADLNSWRRAWPEDREFILTSTSPAEFEERVSYALKRLKSSHVAFFHGSGTRVLAPYALNATFLNPEHSEGVWMFLDVLEGGVAHRAGIVFGETLEAVNGVSARPPEVPRFDLGAEHKLTVLSRTGSPREVVINLPAAAGKGRPPLVEVTAVHSRKLTDDIGYVRVAYFPGAAGDKFALAYDKALADLGPINSLVLDLRGNIGGGLGSLRVMSSLCPDKRPVGFNVTKKVAEGGFDKSRLAKIDHIPTTKLGLIAMAVRFKIFHRDRSIALHTEGLGPRPFHGHIAILVNEHTKSAAEMIAGFAMANGLATVIGCRTAGEVLGGVNFLVGEAYRLRIPVGGWMTWDSQLIERSGIMPQKTVHPSRPSLMVGLDPVLQLAVSVAQDNRASVSGRSS